jgi:hypothetical protein
VHEKKEQSAIAASSGSNMDDEKRKRLHSFDTTNGDSGLSLVLVVIGMIAVAALVLHFVFHTF